MHPALSLKHLCRESIVASKISALEQLDEPGVFPYLLRYYELRCDEPAVFRMFVRTQDFPRAMTALRNIPSSEQQASCLYEALPELLQFAMPATLDFLREQSASFVDVSRITTAYLLEEDAITAEDRSVFAEFLLGVALADVRHVSPSTSGLLLRLLVQMQHDEPLLKAMRLRTLLLRIFEESPSFDINYLASRRILLAHHAEDLCIFLELFVGKHEAVVKTLFERGLEAIAVETLLCILRHSKLAIDCKLRCLKLYKSLRHLHGVQTPLDPRVDEQERLLLGDGSDAFNATTFSEAVDLMGDLHCLGAYQPYILASLRDALHTYQTTATAIRQRNSEKKAAEQQVQALSSALSEVDKFELCWQCSADVCSSDFYLFPCAHAIHQQCVLQNLRLFYREPLIRRIEAVAQDIAKISREDLLGRPKKAAVLTRLEAQLNMCIGTDCPICGEAAIDRIDSHLLIDATRDLSMSENSFGLNSALWAL